MAADQVNRRRMAAAIIIQRLRQGRGKASSRELRAALGRHHFEPRYLGRGIREIRDLYGDNALIVVPQGKGASPLYVLDPKKIAETRAWAKKMFKRALTETRHVIHVLEWSLARGVGASSVKRAKHYAENVEVELENVLTTL